MLSTAAVIPAAGRGERMGPGPAKALRPVCGVPLVVRAVRALTVVPEVRHVAIAAPAELVEETTGLLDRDGPELELGWHVVAGASDRRTSVARALRGLPESIDTVLVHDAARAFVPAEVIHRVVDELAAGAVACVPALPVSDTIKQVADGSVVGTVDRTSLRAIQTPQGFAREVIERAHGLTADTAGVADQAVTDQAVTDDAGLVERLGAPVRIVEGHEEAFKVTRPLDLVMAEALLRQRATDVTVADAPERAQLAGPAGPPEPPEPPGPVEPAEPPGPAEPAERTSPSESAAGTAPSPKEPR